MSRTRFSIGLLAFCAASAIAQTSAPPSAPTAPTAPTAQLAKPEARITDGVIQTDHSTYEAMQARIKALNDSGNRPVRDYFLSKAQCWLDVSFHEYTRNDRSAFTQAALSESEKLVQAMERKQSAISKDTVLVNNAARLRPDLWAQTESLKTRSGASCAAQQTACAEVELVHAGNELNQQSPHHRPWPLWHPWLCPHRRPHPRQSLRPHPWRKRN
jgi:OmpA-OmpF porin, OOP family